jgi:hypothetical protein
MADRFCIVLAAAAVSVGVAGSAEAQVSDTSRFDRTLEQIQRDTRLQAYKSVPADRRAEVDYGAFLTASYFSADDSSGGNTALRQYNLQPYVRLNFDNAHEFYVRGRLQYRDYNPGDESATDDDGLLGYVDEAYYRYDLAANTAANSGRVLDYNLRLTAGRQLVEWGDGLVLSQYMDAGHLEFTSGALTATLLGGVTTYGTTDFDPTRPHYDKSTYRGYYGAMVAAQVQQHRPYAYVLVQRDYNKDRELGTGSVTSSFDYNSYYIGLGSTGALSDRVLYGVEAVYEGGKGLSDSVAFDTTTGTVLPQTHEPIQAWAADMHVDYVPLSPYKLRVYGGLTLASGDPDRGLSDTTVSGNRPGTHDRGFNALGLPANGFAFNPAVSNLIMLRAGVSGYPVQGTGMASRIQVGGEVYAFGKMLTRGPIDESTSHDRYLGFEPDVYVNWRVLEDVTFQGRYGVFVPGQAIDDTNDGLRQFLYLSVTYSF